MPRPTLYVGPAKLPPGADEAAGYIDFFSAEHRNPQPMILIDCTSVKWPAHYTPKDAETWRKHRGIERPRQKRKTPPTRRWAASDQRVVQKNQAK